MELQKKYSILKIDSIIEFLFAIYAFWGLIPYFTWETYYNGIFRGVGNVLFTSIFFILIIATLFLKFYNKEIKIEKYKIIFALICVFSSIVYLGICGNNYKLLLTGSIIPYIVLGLFILLPDEIKSGIFKKYIFLFSITLIPSLLYYVLRLIDIQIPYKILYPYENIKISALVHYRLYPFAVQLESPNPISLFRLCGIYDEAGRLGTVAGLFLTSEKYEFKKKFINCVIFIAGILTFSLSFYLITLVYFIINNVVRGKVKNVVALIFISAVYIIFINININIPVINTLQSRIMITSNGISGDNRTNKLYDQIYLNFKKSDLGHRLFGFGDGAIGIIQRDKGIDGSSYKSIIYNYGYFGFGLSIIWIILLANTLQKYNKKHRYYIIALTIIYILNLYQRPSVFYPPFMFIYLGGIYNKIFEDRHREGKVDENIYNNGGL